MIADFCLQIADFERIPLFLLPEFEIQGGAVAQLVEQRTENPCVGGSIPPHTTKILTVMLGFCFISNGKIESRLSFPVFIL